MLSRQSGCRQRPIVVRERRQWQALPVLTSAHATLRPLRSADAPSLLAMLDADVQRFLPRGPATEQAFLSFIRWSRRAWRMGRHISFGIVPRDRTTAVGIFQVWALEPSFQTAEWGFALGRPYWGTGLFVECAEQVVDFAFDQLDVQRLEARAAVDNVRGNRALEKLGAVREGLLRQCFECSGERLDHVLWSILSDEWRWGSRM